MDRTIPVDILICRLWIGQLLLVYQYVDLDRTIPVDIAICRLLIGQFQLIYQYVDCGYDNTC